MVGLPVGRRILFGLGRFKQFGVSKTKLTFVWVEHVFDMPNNVECQMHDYKSFGNLQILLIPSQNYDRDI